MLACASIVIVGFWFADTAPEALFKTAATLFIVGLAKNVGHYGIFHGQHFKKVVQPKIAKFIRTHG